MDLAYIYGGSNPHVAKVVIGETVRRGVPLVAALTTETGVQECTATAAADAIGCSLEDVTYQSAQQADNSDAERVASVIVNPDAVWKAKLSGGAAENTLLTLFTVDTVNAAGTSVETDTSAATPSKLDGTIWGLAGANKGRKRKITAVTGNHFTVAVPFEPIAVGDTFLAAPFFPFGNNIAAQLTTNLTQARVDIAAGTGIPVVMVGGEFNERGDSFAHLMLRDHYLSGQVA